MLENAHPTMLHTHEPELANSYLEKNEHGLNAIDSITKIFCQSDDPKYLLTQALTILENELDIEQGTIRLYSPDGNEFRVETAKEILNSQQVQIRFQRSEGMMKRVFQTGQAIVIPHIASDPLFQERIDPRRSIHGDVLSFICVPIFIEHEVIGTLSIILPLRSTKSLHENKQTLNIIARLIAYDVYSKRNNLKAIQVLEKENLLLRNTLEEVFRPENIIGNSNVMRDVYLKIHQIAASDSMVLLRGESGTGKHCIASTIHYNSARAKHPFVKVNCAALNENIIECELFGYEKSTFSGSLDHHLGRLAEARGGTLFLDEIGHFSPALQAKLLRLIRENEFMQIGSNALIQADVRLIAATQKNLEIAVETGTFRKDLYDCIHVFPIFLPPLRDRKDDILLLVNYFIEKYSNKMGKRIRRISTTSIDMMTAYHWPGNVRELENCIEHAILLSTDGVIHSFNLPSTMQMPDFSDRPQPGSFKQRVDLLECDLIVDALKRSGGNVTAAAKELGITPRIARYKIEKLKIDIPRLIPKKLDRRS